MKFDEDKNPISLPNHIALVIKIKPWQYEQGWLEYSHRHFTGRFIADHMLLLRRREGELKYKTMGSFKFENLPVDVKQGQLF